MELSGHYYRKASKASLPLVHRSPSAMESNIGGSLDFSLLPQYLFTSQYEDDLAEEEEDQYYYYTHPPLSLGPVLKKEQPLNTSDLTER